MKGEILINEIKEWMKHNHITQQQVAELTGMKQESISRVLRLKNSPSLSTVYKIKAAIGMDTEPEVNQMMEAVSERFNCVLDDSCNRFKTEGCNFNCSLYIQR